MDRKYTVEDHDDSALWLEKRGGGVFPHYKLARRQQAPASTATKTTVVLVLAVMFFLGRPVAGVVTALLLAAVPDRD